MTNGAFPPYVLAREIRCPCERDNRSYYFYCLLGMWCIPDDEEFSAQEFKHQSAEERL